MREIRFVTGNAGKVAFLKSQLDPDKYRVLQDGLAVPEIQADTVLEIASYKARYAYDKLQKPLVVQDSAFHVNALNGFPGPYVKYFMQTIGIKGLLRLMKDTKDRSAVFEHALVYIDGHGRPHPFVSKLTTGTLAQAAYEGKYDGAWSDLWNIYIPAGAGTKTLAELFAAKQQDPLAIEAETEVAQFVGWLQARE